MVVCVLSALSFLSPWQGGQTPTGTGHRVREAARHSRDQAHSWALLCKAPQTRENLTLENILQSSVTDIRRWTLIPDVH